MTATRLRAAGLLTSMLLVGHANADKPSRDVIFVPSRDAMSDDRPRVELLPLLCATWQGDLATGPACYKRVAGNTTVKLGDGRRVRTRGWAKSWKCWSYEMMESEHAKPAFPALQLVGLTPKVELQRPIPAAVWPASRAIVVPPSQRPSPPLSPELAAHIGARTIVQDLSVDLDSDGKPERLVSSTDGTFGKIERGLGADFVIVPGDGGPLVPLRHLLEKEIRVLSISDLDGDDKSEVVTYGTARGEDNVAVYEYPAREPVVDHHCEYL